MYFVAYGFCCAFDTHQKMLLFGVLFLMETITYLWLAKSYQKRFVVSVHALRFQIFTAKLILWPNMCLAYANFISKWIFGIFFFFIKKILFFFTNFKMLMFHKNIMKMLEI